ncbi:MAG: HAD-IIB family hydrolase [Desulfurivibrionaceae bacterium]|nr:HAD-IIB family hydrolase [Desulfobulbales bacterium]MDT8335184.1 HAD-IIB family hydrolase [Desulfurivibrionaceae bacterium]
MSSFGLYIQLFSIHGLVRGESLELGRDADTGGQVKYVVELARSLAEHPAVAQVDLVTRRIEDKSVSDIYNQRIEPLSAKARIVRIQCGGRRYIRKELLWPHLDEFVDKTLKFIKVDAGRIPDIFHGHYADGGYVAGELANIFGSPFLFTGHSMGRHKKNKLLSEGLADEEINRRYFIDWRIGVEERVLKSADRIITSTAHEINKQYTLYDNYPAASFHIIPPGIDVETFHPYYYGQLNAEGESEASLQVRLLLLNELNRFWVSPDKPFILALCRPDHRKNIKGLITSYGEDKELQAIANLAIFAGIRKDIGQMEENERNVLTEMLLLMDRYDLYGKLAIPKKHDFTTEVPELYRLCAGSHGVFVNPALVEPFGLTLIEAASCGLPIVATNDGGPTDIIGNCQNGILIDPSDSQEIARACRDILIDREAWDAYSRSGINGVRSHYVWKVHSDHTVDLIEKVRREMPDLGDQSLFSRQGIGFGRLLTKVGHLLITDIDNTLVGDDAALIELLEILSANRERIAWGVATGRCQRRVMEALAEHRVPPPDIIIASVGTEIYYGSELLQDKGWTQHLSCKWKPARIRETLADLDFLHEQDEDEQRDFKISYLMKDDPDYLAGVHQALQARKLSYHLQFSNSQFLDILPFRASKGKAIRYLSYKWEFPLKSIMVCGDSGNDEEMLRGDTCGVVVGNYSKELEHLRGLRRMYFSRKEYAAGIIDGIKHYRFLEN